MLSASWRGCEIAKQFNVRPDGIDPAFCRKQRDSQDLNAVIALLQYKDATSLMIDSYRFLRGISGLAEKHMMRLFRTVTAVGCAVAIAIGASGQTHDRSAQGSWVELKAQKCPANGCGLVGPDRKLLLSNLDEAIVPAGSFGFAIPERILLAAISKPKTCVHIFPLTATGTYKRAKHQDFVLKSRRQAVVIVKVGGKDKLFDADLISELFQTELFPPRPTLVKMTGSSEKGFLLDKNGAEALKSTLREAISPRITASKWPIKMRYVSMRERRALTTLRNGGDPQQSNSDQRIVTDPVLRIVLNKIRDGRESRIGPDSVIVAPYGASHGSPPIPIANFNPSVPACLLNITLSLPRIDASVYAEVTAELTHSKLGTLLKYAPENLDCPGTKDWPALNVQQTNCRISVGNTGKVSTWTFSGNILQPEADTPATLGLFFAPTTENIDATLRLWGKPKSRFNSAFFNLRPQAELISEWLVVGSCK